MATPLLRVEALEKRYHAPGWPRRETFHLEADFVPRLRELHRKLGA